MTTQIPTSNLPTTSLPGIPAPTDIVGLAPAAGLPDIAALTQMASDFFAALPGKQPFSFGAPPESHLTLGQNLPAIVPTSPPVTVPEPAAITSSHAGRAGSPQIGVPEVYAPALPSVGSSAIAFPTAPASAPSSPYYFLGESSAYQTAPQSGGQPAEDRITAQPYDLPGSLDLGRVLAEVLGSGGKPTQASVPEDAPRQAAPSNNFYFVDTAGAPSRSSIDKAPDTAGQPSPNVGFDVNAVRRDFPILAERVNGKPLVWLDNAATTQKPRAVIDRISYFYEHENSNIHRAAHELAARATDAYEGARNKVARFLGAKSAEEIVFVRGATEAINLVANTFGRQFIGEGDEIIVSHLEHHANIVPWQMLAASVGAKIRVIPVDDTGQIILSEYAKLLCPRTRLVAITQVSNALGTVTPVQEVVRMAHAVGARALVDGAQSVSHMRVNVQAIDADFFVFSGHKVFGPTGIGVVYGKKELLDQLQPWQGGGNMIADVTFERTVYQPAPMRFEAGTGNIADAVGLGAAIDYVERIGLDNIARYEHDLLVYATHHLQRVPGVRLIGTAVEKASVLSFVLKGYRTEEVGQALNREGIAVRSGHHCAQPILRRFGLEATVRPSLAFYNTCQEVDLLVSVVQRLANSR